MMRAPMWVGASSTTLVFLLLAWLLPNLLGLDGGQLWVLRSTLAFLGLVAGFLVHRFMAVRARARGPKVRDPAAEELDLLLREARTRLGVGGSGPARLGRRPVLLVLGPHGGAKTTTILRSGMEPELLAGEVHRGDAIVPTEAVNLWYADGTVVVEAGGDVTGESARWSQLLERLRPARLGAALLRRAQAPRVAVVCVPLDHFVGPHASGSSTELARSLRGRLADAAREFGIQLPVYVILTRADRIPYFEDFVRNLTAEESAEVLGATLPLRSFTSTGTYGDEQSRRVGAALEELTRNLARKRLELLPRENSEPVRQGAYEFPRELGKLSEPLREFLVELCRPGHMGASPLLRGFYFTGVRPVLVSEGAPVEELPREPAAPEAVTEGATSVFNAAELREAMRKAEASGPRTRKIPEWTFLRRLFQDVILRDRIAMGLTGSGQKVSLLRRAALGGGVALIALVLLGMTISFSANRSLQKEVAEALRGSTAVATTASAADGASSDGDAVVDVEALRRLDELGNELDRLRAWEEGRPPAWYRFGLYRGSRILPEVRTAYFHRFEEELWSGTRAQLVAFLDDLPEEPGEDADYDGAYTSLRTYLVTTDYPDRSAPEAVSPVLERHWGFAQPEGEDEATALARRNFQRFARELRFGNPYDAQATVERVERARGHLGRFAARDQLYQALLSGVGMEVDAYAFEEAHPDAPPAVRNDQAVPGAFTRMGWDAVQEILADPEALLVSEEWVVGEGRAVSPEERRALAAELGELYEREYVERWIGFLQRTSVPGYASERQAAERLDRLSRSDSPAIRLLSDVSRHTAVDSEPVRAAFRPLHGALPPEDVEEEAAEQRRLADYLNDLSALHSSLDELARASGDAGGEVGRADGDARQADRRVSDLARDLPRDEGAGRVADQMERILREPIRHAQSLVGGFEERQARSGINQEAQAMCRAFEAVAARYPFNRTAGSEADVSDVEAVLAPGDGWLRSFQEEFLAELVTRRGGRYEAATGASPTPTTAYLEFHNRARAITDALFRLDGGPGLSFGITMEASERVPRIEVAVDGPAREFTRTRTGQQILTWDAGRARSAQIAGEVDGRRVVLVEGEPEGPWALFRLFRDARWNRLGDGSFEVVWEGLAEAGRLTGRVSPEAEVFRPGFLEGLRCPGQAVR